VNKVVIDGYNLIHSVPELRRELEISLEKGREALMKKLQSYLASRQVRITVVFDGSEPPPGVDPSFYGASLSVRFSRNPFKADPLIKEIIRSSDSKRSVTLVSKDADIVQYARSRKVNVLEPEAFYNRLEKEYRTSDNESDTRDMSDDELADWLKLFGEDRETDESRRKAAETPESSGDRYDRSDLACDSRFCFPESEFLAPNG
jgi:predicted RNA-binding protein with PIN domain